jgi:hypothetical protein
MTRMTIILSGLVLLGLGSVAYADEREMFEQIAREANVSVDDVRMVLGSRSNHAQYRTAFDHKQERVLAAMARIERQQQAARTAQLDPKEQQK